MFEKMKLKKQIEDLEEQIQNIEKKRSRSQAALVEAILTRVDPDDEDVDFFNKYTAEINELRDEMKVLQGRLETL